MQPGSGPALSNPALIWSAAMALVTTLSGCPLPGAGDRQYACNDSSNCAEGWTCDPASGFCRAACIGPEDCPAELVCVGGICMAPAGSSSSTLASSGTGSSSGMDSSSGIWSSSSSPSSSSSGGLLVTPRVVLSAGGLSVQNSVNRINLCVGQPLTGADPATPSQLTWGVLSSITPESEGTLP